MNIVRKQLSSNVTLCDRAIDVWNYQFLSVVPKEYFHVYFFFCRACVQDELCFVHPLLQFHLLNCFSVRAFPVPCYQFCWEVVCWWIVHCELLLLVLWRYVNFCEVFTCEIRDKLWLCKLVTYHIINQLRRKLLSVSQATRQYRNSKLPSVQTIINFHDQLRIAQVFWWVLDKLLIRNAFLIKLCQNIVTFLFFLQWTLAQWNVKQRLLRWLLPFVYLLLYFL